MVDPWGGGAAALWYGNGKIKDDNNKTEDS
jgi:hypothetical protein